MPDSNRRPARHKHAALPTELMELITGFNFNLKDDFEYAVRNLKVLKAGFEPTKP